MAAGAIGGGMRGEGRHRRLIGLEDRRGASFACPPKTTEGRDKPSSLGFGLGLRPVYYQEILEKPRVRWFEVISENYMTPSGRPLVILKRIRADFGSVANFAWRLTGV